jgi:glycosyltransferase involved in cell wall biosynthesis
MSGNFSIAMCTYNGAAHLREQLDSIAAQIRPPDELVIFDDCSTDATREIVKKFTASSPFPVHFSVNEQNLGSTRNFERAIAGCTGDFIALCDQDDVWLPEKLAEFEKAFEGFPNVGLIFTDAELIDESARDAAGTLWERIGVSPDEIQRLRGPKAIDSLLPGSTVTGATMAFRARFKELVLPIPADLPIIHDAWITILIAAVSEVLPLSTPLTKYRQHQEQQVGAKARQQGEAGVMEARRRKTSYDEMIQIVTEAHQRLSERSTEYESTCALSRLETRLNHLRARADLPAGVLSRARCVGVELFSRRYHRYSNGFRSALKDLLA